MATQRAVANGNWSATGTWNGGVVPGNGDTVYANGFNVTLDTDVLIGGANNPTVSAGSFVSGQWYEIDFVGTTTWTAIGAASNTASTVFLATGVGSGTGTAKALATLTTAANTPAGATAGGSFVMSTVRAISTDLRAGTTTCLNVTASSGTLSLSGIRALSGSAAGAHAINNSNAAAVEITSCNFTGGGSAVAAFAFNNASTGSITISNSSFAGGTTTNTTAFTNASTGSITISSSTFNGGSGSSNTFGINNASTASVTCDGCTFTGGNGASANGINNAATGSITISNSTFTGGAAGPACNNASTGTLIVSTSTFTASSSTNAVNIANNSADVRLSGDFLDHWSGFKSVNGGKWRLGTTPSAARTRYALAGTTDSYVEMFTADNETFGQPAITDVRSGVTYGGGILEGVCAVPAASSVAFGVPVDATTGTAALTPAAVWEYATRSITGGTVDTLTNAPSVPSAATIASQVRTELGTELGRIDAAVSSRLAPSGTLATVTTLTNAPSVPSASTIASQVRTELTTELARIDAPISAATAPTASTVATAVRTELGTELGRLDAAITTRAATGTLATDVTAIRAKTDALVTDRLAQCSTVSTTGAQLAAALS